MSNSPPEGEPNDSVETLYRRLAKLDPSEPAPATREAIIARARELANSRSAADVSHNSRSLRFRWGHSAAVGALAASIVIALVIAPRYLPPGNAIDGQSQPQSPVAPPANRALQMAPPAGLATDRQLAEGTAARPQPTPPPAAGPSAASATASAPAAKSVMPEDRRADVAPPDTGVGSAQRAMRAPNAADRSAFAARAPEVAEPPQERLRRAAEAGDVGLIATLAPELTDLNARDAQGRTAVMIATLHGQTAAVTTLLSLGADPNAADVNGVTPIQAARGAGAGAIVAALERYGAH